MGERDSKGDWDGHIRAAIFKMNSQQGPMYSTGNSSQCYVASCMGRELGGEGIHVYVWLSPFPVHLKLWQHCLLHDYTPISNKTLKERRYNI